MQSSAFRDTKKTIMHSYPSQVRSEIFKNYLALLTALEEARKLKFASGLQFRNAAYSLVSSNYTKDDQVSEKLKTSIDSGLRVEILTGLADALKDEIDFFGQHLKPEEMIYELNEIISQSLQSEHYKTAAILATWRDTFLEQ